MGEQGVGGRRVKTRAEVLRSRMVLGTRVGGRDGGRTGDGPFS